jgi:hypothetical protein
MDLDPSRLRRGELIVGAGSVVLLASMFLLKWYAFEGRLPPNAVGIRPSLNGWQGLTTLRWLMLVTVLCGLALVYLQAARSAPAVPVSLSVIVAVLGFLTALALLYRVLISTPGADGLVSVKPGGYVALASAIVIFYGGYRSMRDEGIADKDAPPEIETVSLGSASGS